MCCCAYPLTTPLKVVKELQWVKETIEGVTPSNPTFQAIPTNTYDLFSKSNRDTKYRKLGNADLTKTIPFIEDYDISISYTPIGLDTLFYSMINLTGASGNRENSFTFLLSQQHNQGGALVEQYQIARGCKILSSKIRVRRGQLVGVDSKWLAASATDWSTSHGLTTPTFASPLTGTPWSPTTTGTSPLVFDGNSYDVDNFTVTIDHNTERVHVLDTAETVKLQPGVRDIEIDMGIVYKNTVLSSDVRTFTPRSMLLSMHTENEEIATLEFSNVYLEEYDETVAADSSKAKIISYVGFATLVNLTLEESGSKVRALPTESASIFEVLTKLVHLSRVTRALPTETVLLFDFVNRVNSAAGNIVRSLATETTAISEDLAKLVTLHNFARALPAETVSISESLAKLVTYPQNIVRALATQTTSISENLARVVTHLGPTRLYFHAAIDSTSGLPTAEQASRNSDLNVEGSQTTNRQMTTTIGTSQAVLSGTPGSSALKQIYFTRFVSPPVNVTSISANTWTYNFSTKQSETGVNFPVDVANAVFVTCYVWRPGTGKIANILDGFSAANVDEPGANTQVAHHTTFSGSSVASVSSGTDVIIFEVWFDVNPDVSGADGTFNFYYDGTTVNTTNNATVSNHASFIETPQPLY